MTRYDAVCRAYADLDRALEEYIAEVIDHHSPREVAADVALREMPPRLVRTLLDAMPTLAGPWRVTDMRDGEPTRLVRDGYMDTIATVRRHGQGRRGRPRWTAYVGDDLVSPPDVDENGDAMPIDWSTCEEAQAACDHRLREGGVLLEEVG